MNVGPRPIHRLRMSRDAYEALPPHARLEAGERRYVVLERLDPRIYPLQDGARPTLIPVDLHRAPVWTTVTLPDGRRCMLRAEREPAPLPPDHPDFLPLGYHEQRVVALLDVDGDTERRELQVRRGWTDDLPPALALMAEALVVAT